MITVCGDLRPGEGEKFYHTRQGWKKVELITKIRAQGSDSALALQV